MPEIAVDQNGKVLAVSENPIRVISAPKELDVAPGWSYESDRFIAPPRFEGKIRREILNGCPVDIIDVSTFTSMPNGINATYVDGVIRSISSSTSEEIQIFSGDLVAVVSDHALDSELALSNVKERGSFFVLKSQGLQQQTKE